MVSIRKILPYRNHLFLYLFFVLIFNLVLINFPLTNVFSFEFSFANSIFLALLSGLYAIAVVKNYACSKVSNTFSNFLITYILFLLLPLVVIFIKSFFSIHCPFIEGFSFYIVITFPSIVVGTALGLLVSFIVPKFRIIFFILLFILILFIPLYEFYVNPQVYFYNPIFGYFPGTIYDEAISVSYRLIVYRLLNLIFFGSVILLTSRAIFLKKGIGKSLLTVITMIVAVVFFYLSPVFGFSTNIARMKKYLDKEITTNHFKIYYSSKLNDNLIKCIVLYHEYYFEELSKFFEIKPDVRITSFLFLNSEQKKELLGSANADIAKPWLRQVYIDYNDFASILKHELAHCFAGFFGTGPFKIADNFNPYLTEGTAVAADPIYDDDYVNYLAALAYKHKYLPDFSQFLNPIGFYVQPSSTSYIYAGSFSSYLIDNYGIKKFKELYSNVDFNKIYGQSLDNLSKQYYSFLDTITVTATIDKAYYYFGRTSIFYKACPRYIANTLDVAWNDYQSKNYKEAKRKFENILSVSNNYSAVIGLSYSEFNLNNQRKAIELLESKINNYKKSAYYYSMELSLGDLLSKDRDAQDADTNYSNLINQKPSYTFLNLANLRQELSLNDTLIGKYIKGKAKTKFDILKKLNSNTINYSSIPVLVELAENLNVDFNIFKKVFEKKFTVNNFSSSYAAYKLSMYFARNLDFSTAVKFASMSLKYKQDRNFYNILQSNFDTQHWIYKNEDLLLATIKEK